MAPSLAKEAEDTSTAGSHRACSNGRSGRTNVVMANPQQKAGFPQRNSYAMDVDRRDNRNCYACGRYRHLARNCRNRGMGMNRRIKID